MNSRRWLRAIDDSTINIVLCIIIIVIIIIIIMCACVRAFLCDVFQ